MIPASSRGRRRFRSAPPERGAPAARPATAAIETRLTSASIVPYDYSSRFRLTGNPGNLVQDVMNVSPDGIFVAAGISYGFEQDRATPDLGPNFSPQPNAQPPGALSPTLVLPGRISLGEIPVDALIQGFRVNPGFDRLVFPAGTESPDAEPELSDDPRQGVPPDFARNLFQKLLPPVSLSFLFNIVDSGTGRELQDEPVNNIASLGISTGDRPFRLLARPVAFLPRSNLRLQVIEQTRASTGILHIVIFGYKLLGAGQMSEAEVRSLAEAIVRRRREQPSGSVIPFDYATTFELTGRAGNLLTDEVVVNVEGGFMATAIGYGIVPTESGVRLRGLTSGNGRVRLGGQLLRSFPPAALRDGIRLRPEFLRQAFDPSGALASGLPLSLADSLFERINRPQDLSFLYSIYDSARGRDLQNQPIHNIAGLGIADGSRPFRHLVFPLRVLPRSTLRVEVEERFGRGRLFIVFQGYKILGGRP